MDETDNVSDIRTGEEIHLLRWFFFSALVNNGECCMKIASFSARGWH